MKIILASNSPRRKELLSAMDLEFEVRTMDGIDESYPENLDMTAIPEYISANKAAAYDISSDEMLITADTIVYLNGEVLGKPSGEKEACDMLEKLSGHTHQVVTGVTIRTTGHTRTFSCVTDVTFDILTKKQIRHYVSKYKPFDKAGAYGIQEWIGCIGVTGINGSFYNVMGLPVQRLCKELATFPGTHNNMLPEDQIC